MTFPILAERTLASTSVLSTRNSCCPTKDLIILTSSDQSTLNLLRTSNQADQVWTYKLGTTAATKDVKGKGKASSQSFGEITEMAWHPHGDYIALASSKSNVTILSVHTGLPVLPALQLPANSNASTSNDSTVTHLSWQLLAIPAVDIESHAVLLISRLPALPTLDSESKSNTASAAVAASGVFASAKNAMLLRERAKEAGRALDVVIASKGFPTLIQSNLINEKLGDSVLVVGDREGKAHFYLGGSVYIGSVEIQKDASIIGVSVLPKSTLTPNAPSQISILLSRLDYRIDTSTLELRLPSTTLLLAQQTTLLKEMIQHAFESLQEARVLWDEARRVATAWLARLAELGEPHGVSQPPTTQLMVLLATGRHNPALFDFLASKMNERGFTKLETATISAFQRLKKCTFMSLAPAMERSVLLLDEAKSWSIWPEHFARFNLDITKLSQCVVIASEVIVKSSSLESIVIEQEVCFMSFCKWIRYELEKIAFADGSEIHPHARFHPLSVAHYIEFCLANSLITPYLAFGLQVTSLDGNVELMAADEWCTRKEREVTREETKVDDGESLTKMMKRMKQELRGQLDAENFSNRNPGMKSDMTPERSSIPRSETDQTPPSIPILLHLLASKVGDIFSSSLEGLVGDLNRADSAERMTTELGRKTAEGSVVRSWLVNQGGDTTLFHAWIEEKELIVTRSQSTGDVVATCHLSLMNQDNESLEIIDFDFFDDIEMVFVIKITSDRIPVTSTYSLSTLRFHHLNYSTIPMKSTPIPFERTHQLSSQFAPSQLSLNGRAGRRMGCVLSGNEGRRLEILDLDGVQAVENDIEMK